VPLRLPELAASVHAETLAAVTLGAVVATLSGVAANLWEARIRRRERERSAALLFGEVISTLRTILAAALDSMSVGERYGQVTRRMLISARREVDIYERNRESLIDLRDPQLRVDVHSLMVRMTMPLDGILASLTDPSLADPEARERGVGFMVETLTKFPPLIERLARVAHQSFDRYDDVFAPGTASDVAARPLPERK
jgi:hypothetical protein